MSLSSFEVYYYNLFLGDQDSVTGWYRKGYVIQSVTMVIVSRAYMYRLSGLGIYSRHDAVGITNYDVREGSIIKDSHDDYYTIMGIQPFKWGNQLAFYKCDLKERLHFPFISDFFGFEILVGEPGAVVQGFEDGFERGYWAL